VWTDIGFPWWLFWLIAAIFLLGIFLLFRSFRRWQQPRPGNDAEARDADMKLQTMSKRSGGSWGG
jgi:hypothetical protein